MSIERLGIIGIERNSAEIAQLAALKGLSIILVDANRERLEKTVSQIRASIDSLIQKKIITENEKEPLIARIQLALDFKVLHKAEFIIDSSMTPDPSKRDLFLTLDKMLDPEIVLASSSQTTSITEFAQNQTHSGRMIGLHLAPSLNSQFNFIEIVRGVQTDEKTIHKAKDLALRLGLESVVSQDFPGFILSRVIALMINEAVYVLYEGVASAEDIDHTFKASQYLNIGPLALADVIGLDRVLNILKTLYHSYGNSKYVPCPLLVKYVEAGYLGKSTGKGFYEYKESL